jgi:hypothetical protein
MRGAMPRETGMPDALAGRIHRELADRGLAGEPLGIDLTDMETLYSLQRQGIETADAQPVMMRATATGCRVITKFPADELLVCGKTYIRGADLLDLEESAV